MKKHSYIPVKELECKYNTVNLLKSQTVDGIEPMILSTQIYTKSKHLKRMNAFKRYKLNYGYNDPIQYILNISVHSRASFTQVPSNSLSFNCRDISIDNFPISEGIEPGEI